MRPQRRTGVVPRSLRRCRAWSVALGVVRWGLLCVWAALCWQPSSFLSQRSPTAHLLPAPRTPPLPIPQIAELHQDWTARSSTKHSLSPQVRVWKRACVVGTMQARCHRRALQANPLPSAHPDLAGGGKLGLCGCPPFPVQQLQQTGSAGPEGRPAQADQGGVGAAGVDDRQLCVSLGVGCRACLEGRGVGCLVVVGRAD